MNNTYQLLSNLKHNCEESMLATDFEANLKRFEYLINERSAGGAKVLDEFLKSCPEHLLDITEDENALNNLFSIAEECEDGKITSIEALDKEEISTYFKFNKSGKLTALIFENEGFKLILNSNMDLVLFERKNLYCFKFVDILKDHYTLNIRRANDADFECLLPVEKDKLDKNILFDSMLWG